MSVLYSLQLEKHVLGGLIKHPLIFADIERFINEKDFYNEVHVVIFSAIKNTILEKKTVDVVLLSERISNLGISFKDEIPIKDYLDDICFTQITKKATLDAASQLANKTARRELHDVGEQIISISTSQNNDKLDDLIAKCDSTYGEKIASYDLTDEPLNLFEGVEELLEERGNNPNEEVGLLTPYPEFNRLYGGLRPGNIYAIVSRPGQGKTTWINDMAFKTALKNKKQVLILDTEMCTVDIQFRMMAAISGVDVWHLETGNWRKNADMVEKVREAIEKSKEFVYYHYHVGNKNIDQICSLVRRWYLSKVKRGDNCIIAYDYLKLTGEKMGNNWAEYQVIGEKIDKLKRLGEEINAVVITAMQLNRQGESHNRRAANVVDDSSAIALSDRLQWFASFVAIFRRKTIDEIAMDGNGEDGNPYGTHKLIPLKTRFQGKDATGHQDVILRMHPDGTERYAMNFLNFDVTNFNVEERGSLRDIDERMRSEVEDPNFFDGDTL